MGFEEPPWVYGGTRILLGLWDMAEDRVFVPQVQDVSITALVKFGYRGKIRAIPRAPMGRMLSRGYLTGTMSTIGSELQLLCRPGGASRRGRRYQARSSGKDVLPSVVWLWGFHLMQEHLPMHNIPALSR